ncbi:conserved phage C-terminal domain-containing protein [Klebsiella quasipneumoniae]|uniref:conserved phage C-terminal domain-containing protein n=2 Tax=Klebsiella pneumoniae complex TaxID=3390273 RepID=UPI002245BB7C|nr:conserved phage C-terminal domain-containing protein [Klebsiella quasipneumoniae]MCW9412904.1 conserved phage C-terminal domain-containing protein [Klebsiella quasipneumoniae]
MRQIFDIVQSLSGQRNSITIPVPYLDFFAGDQQAHALGAVLNQLVFWSGKSALDNGWFYKEHSELATEIRGVSEDQIQRLVNKICTRWLPGIVEKSQKQVNGTKKTHYRIRGEALIDALFPATPVPSDSAESRNGKREVAEPIPQNHGTHPAESRNLKREVAEPILYTDHYTDHHKQIIKPSCPVPVEPDGKPDPEVVITDHAIEVLTHLNQVSGSRFQKSKTSLENIRARLREGHTVPDLKLVIDVKHEHWHGNDEQYQYMRPETLFGPKKFEGYLQSAIRWDAKGRPPRECWDRSKPRDINQIGAVQTTIPKGFRG